jgi:protein ImuA
MSRVLELLRGQVRALEGGVAAARSLPLGVPALDARLPGGGLRLAALHEVEGARDEWDDAPAAGFCLALAAPLAAALGRPLLWVARRPDLDGAGLAAMGLDPGRLIFAQADGEREVLWALEQGLRCTALAGVVGEVAEPAATAGRRLQLAAEAGGVTAFLLRRRFAPVRRAPPPSVALTRWRVAALPSGAAPLEDLPGRPRWRVELRRCRGAAPASFLMEWDDASGGFALAAVLRDGSPDPWPAQAAGPDGRRAG